MWKSDLLALSTLPGYISFSENFFPDPNLLPLHIVRSFSDKLYPFLCLGRDKVYFTFDIRLFREATLTMLSLLHEKLGFQKHAIVIQSAENYT